MGLGFDIVEEMDCSGGKVDPLVESMRKTYTDSILEALGDLKFNFVITDPRLPDNPIVYASEGFCIMSGYSRDEVFGRNCRFLHGPDTNRRTVLELRDAVCKGRPACVRILNYSKGGTPFWNLLHLSPLFSKEDGTVTNFVGVQTPISTRLAASLMENEKVLSRLPMDSDPHDTFRQNGESNPGRLGLDSWNVNPTGTQPYSYSSSIATCEPNGDECGLEQVEMSLKDRGTWKYYTHKAQDGESLKAMESMERLVTRLVESSNGKVLQNMRKPVSERPGAGVINSSLLLSLTRIQQSFVLTDPHLPDMPIVHASELFLHLTGYARDEVIGRNCRFLQGPGTDPAAVAQIRECTSLEKPCRVRLLNYRKDRSPFWNLLQVSPVRNCEGKVAFFVGVQLQVSAVDEEHEEGIGLSARMKQLSAVGAVRVAVRCLQGGLLHSTVCE